MIFEIFLSAAAASLLAVVTAAVAAVATLASIAAVVAIVAVAAAASLVLGLSVVIVLCFALTFFVAVVSAQATV